METIHDVLRVLVEKARGGRLLDEEAEQAHAVIDRDEAAHAPETAKDEAPDGEGQ